MDLVLNLWSLVLLLWSKTQHAKSQSKTHVLCLKMVRVRVLMWLSRLIHTH